MTNETFLIKSGDFYWTGKDSNCGGLGWCTALFMAKIYSRKSAAERVIAGKLEKNVFPRMMWVESVVVVDGR